MNILHPLEEREREQTSFIVRSTLADSPGSCGRAVSVDTAGRLGAGVQHAVTEGVALNITILVLSKLHHGKMSSGEVQKLGL